MIITLSGTVTHRGEAFAIVENNGIGYKVSVPERVARTLGERIDLFTHEVMREDGRELFGFLSISALELFWKLLNVSGVGPRSAQKIVYVGSGVEEVKANIMKGNLTFLTNVPGIGNKTAQKIILELKGVLVEDSEGEVADTDALEALVGLGYARRQAAEALARCEGNSGEAGPGSAGDTEARIRAALKILSR